MDHCCDSAEFFLHSTIVELMPPTLVFSHHTCPQSFHLGRWLSHILDRQSSVHLNHINPLLLERLPICLWKKAITSNTIPLFSSSKSQQKFIKRKLRQNTQLTSVLQQANKPKTRRDFLQKGPSSNQVIYSVMLSPMLRCKMVSERSL